MKRAYVTLENENLIVGEVVFKDDKHLGLTNSVLNKSVECLENKFVGNTKVPVMAIQKAFFVNIEENNKEQVLTKREKFIDSLHKEIRMTLDSYLNFNEESELDIVCGKILDNICSNDNIKELMPND